MSGAVFHVHDQAICDHATFWGCDPPTIADISNHAARCWENAPAVVWSDVSYEGLMKIAIVVAGVIVVAAAVLVAVQPSFLKPASLALVQKSDILGFSPGMTFDETNKLITQRRYRCRQLRDS